RLPTKLLGELPLSATRKKQHNQTALPGEPEGRQCHMSAFFVLGPVALFGLLTVDHLRLRSFLALVLGYVCLRLLVSLRNNVLGFRLFLSHECSPSSATLKRLERYLVPHTIWALGLI